MEFKNLGLDQLGQVAGYIIKQFGSHKIICFYGDMGTGKTSLIKEICSQLGVRDEVTSPTFSLVNEYLSDQIGTIYHFDFYRIRSIDEVYDIGYEEYFYSDSLVLIEWPELIHELLRDDRLIVKIELNKQNSRNYIIEEV